MRVRNVHSRQINQPKAELIKLLSTLATKDDLVWPTESWPAMRFANGLKMNAEGGHGPIRYVVKKHEPAELIEFEFQRPSGFDGVHRLEIEELNPNQTKITHTIDIKTDLMATLQWSLFIRWLHDALIEDAFDKVENQFSEGQKNHAMESLGEIPEGNDALEYFDQLTLLTFVNEKKG